MKYIGIVGSRKRSEYGTILYILKGMKEKHGEITLVSGGAYGIDETAYKIAIKLNIPTILYFPKLDEYPKKGNKIYFERNKKIAEKSDKLYAFPYCRKGGTMNTIKHFIELGKEDNLIIVD